MKAALASGLAALLVSLTSAGDGHAQPAAPPTPTTRILAIGTVNRLQALLVLVESVPAG